MVGSFPVTSSSSATPYFYDGVEEDDETTLFPFASGPLVFTISLKSMFLEIILHFVNIFINAIPFFTLMYFFRELLFADDKSLFRLCFLLLGVFFSAMVFVVITYDNKEVSLI